MNAKGPKRGPGQPPISPGDPLKSTNVLLPGSYYKRIEKLVEAGKFKTQSEAVRRMIEAGLKKFE
ncbi:MAG TPA: ribbon-helix-helix domain-containing protein, partial [Leptospiraceae bacterium]|nr:ribbon-helix-helix domain-containing protein [Leptospiraceae bacterium]HNL00849.1 ribbon-helix-helix domain-containing protein [Leptospiraceae bacterium]